MYIMYTLKSSGSKPSAPSSLYRTPVKTSLEFDINQEQTLQSQMFGKNRFKRSLRGQKFDPLIELRLVCLLAVNFLLGLS
jgi:hypothetical protein